MVLCDYVMFIGSGMSWVT